MSCLLRLVLTWFALGVKRGLICRANQICAQFVYQYYSKKGSKLHSNFLLSFPAKTLEIIEKTIKLNITYRYILLHVIIGHLLFYMRCGD